MAKEDKIRFTLELSPDADEILDKMASKTGGSKSEVLRRAMLLLQVALEARERGEKFAFTDSNLKPLREVIVL